MTAPAPGLWLELLVGGGAGEVEAWYGAGRESAIAGHPAFRVERIEKELPPPSYTAETLAELHRRHPADEFHLLMGSDSLPDLPGWYEPRAVLERAGLVVVPRPGVMLWTPDRLAKALDLPADAVRMRYVACPMIEIASRELRRALGHAQAPAVN